MSENPKVEGHANATANITVGTSADPLGARDVSSPRPEAKHLTVEKYEEDERVEAPDWYDDTINVGDEANKDTP